MPVLFCMDWDRLGGDGFGLRQGNGIRNQYMGRFPAAFSPLHGGAECIVFAALFPVEELSVCDGKGGGTGEEVFKEEGALKKLYTV